MGAKLGFPELQVGLVLPNWPPRWTCAANLGSQGALGRHFDLQLGLQVPLQSTPDRQFCSTVQHFSYFLTNQLFCSPNALGLLSGSSWGLLGSLLGSISRLLSAPWAPLVASWTALGLILERSGRLLDSTGPHYCLSWPSGRHLDTIWTPSGRQLDVKWAPVGLPKRLPVSTYVLRTPKQPPSPTERLANSTFVAGWRHMQH